MLVHLHARKLIPEIATQCDKRKRPGAIVAIKTKNLITVSRPELQDSTSIEHLTPYIGTGFIVLREGGKSDGAMIYHHKV